VQHVLGVDHCPLIVHDLDAAERTMHRLGFRPTPRDIHSAPLGTAHATVPFRDGTYLEAVGVLRPTPHNDDRRDRLAARGEGPVGLAFKTDDAGAAPTMADAVLLAPRGWMSPSPSRHARPEHGHARLEAGAAIREVGAQEEGVQVHLVARTGPDGAGRQGDVGERPFP
jgi:hypothetical protein